MIAPRLEECANVASGARCPHCGGHRTHLTRMRCVTGVERQFWSCDKCKRSWSPEPEEGGSGAR